MAIGSRLTQPAPAASMVRIRFGGRMTASPRRNHYGVIYADPPWTFATYSRKGKGRSAEAYYDRELHRVNASSIAPGISGFSSLGSRQCIRAKKDRQCSLDMVTGIG
jgi:hypothetical protein